VGHIGKKGHAGGRRICLGEGLVSWLCMARPITTCSHTIRQQCTMQTHLVLARRRIILPAFTGFPRRWLFCTPPNLLSRPSPIHPETPRRPHNGPPCFSSPPPSLVRAAWFLYIPEPPKFSLIMVYFAHVLALAAEGKPESYYNL
jgi:hypothetical protein